MENSYTDVQYYSALRQGNNDLQVAVDILMGGTLQQENPNPPNSAPDGGQYRKPRTS